MEWSLRIIIIPRSYDFFEPYDEDMIGLFRYRIFKLWARD